MSKKYSNSKRLFERAQKTIPSGVNSPVRAFRGVGGSPFFVQNGKGARICDADENSYIDYVNSWGAMILGHAYPDVVAAVQRQAAQSLGFGIPVVQEIELAELICNRIPSIEQVRLVNSGTEATMSAVRLARGFTRRTLIAKFAGCYHGHVDSLLISAGSGGLTFGIPDSAGVPANATCDTLILPYNDIQSATMLFEKYGRELAAVIVEPVAGNMNCILPAKNFLQSLRELCNQVGCLLIFDEIITGFRIHSQGAQGLYGVNPDLTTLGKIIGGGMPIGAFGGRQDIMSCIAPQGEVYQAGTLSGNPISVAAGLATLKALEEPGFYERLEGATQNLVSGFLQLANKHSIPLVANQVCGLFGLFFTDKAKVDTYDGVVASDIEQFKRFFHHMLEAGVYLAPSAFEVGFVSAAHDDEVIAETLQAVDICFQKLASHRA